LRQRIDHEPCALVIAHLPFARSRINGLPSPSVTA
jgi:hypothetical protein